MKKVIDVEKQQLQESISCVRNTSKLQQKVKIVNFPLTHLEIVNK
jgi:hypothetical protein